MFGMDDIIRLKQRSEEEDMALEIVLGKDKVLVEVEDTIHFILTNNTLIEVIQKTAFKKDIKVIINTELITSIRLIPNIL